MNLLLKKPAFHLTHSSWLLYFHSMFDPPEADKYLLAYGEFDVRGALPASIRVQFKRSPAEGCNKLVRVCSCASVAKINSTRIYTEKAD